MRKERDHSEHYTGQKTKDGDGLENVEKRNENDFGAARAGREVAVAECE